jgi:GGDEF domain-containing protein
MQQEFARKYILTRVGRVLLEQLQDSAIITQADEHFVVLLPETPRDELQPILQTLQSISEQKLGLKLSIGTATFPDEEITLESLLQRAESAMSAAPSPSNMQSVSSAPSSLGLAPVERSTNIPSVS